jgi:serine/threonine-protein kinase OSR1/STK39
MNNNIYNYPLMLSGYILGEKIGKGAFSTVYHSQVIETNQHVAIKLIDIEECSSDIDILCNETIIMATLHHDNLTNLYCSFVDSHYLVIVMPFLEAGSCSSILHRIAPNGFKDDKLLATILKNVLEGLHYLHNNHKIHRDIKPNNILISKDGIVQLSDFGISSECDNKQKKHTFTGTLNYMAPELVDNEHGYDNKIDIWSIGITALELAFGHSPYKKLSPLQIMKTILNDDPPSCNTFNDRSYEFSNKFKLFIKKCLQKDPLHRPPVEQLLDDKFIKSAENKDYIKKHLISKLNLDLLPIKKTDSHSSLDLVSIHNDGYNNTI